MTGWLLFIEENSLTMIWTWNGLENHHHHHHHHHPVKMGSHYGLN